MTPETSKKIRFVFNQAGVEKSLSASGRRSVDDILKFLLDELHQQTLPGVRVVPIRCEVTEYIPIGLTRAHARRYTVNLTKGADHEYRNV